MREFARSAATFLSALLLWAGAASAADLRDAKEAASVMRVFPARAELRLLNIWATWCVPCVAEMPDLRAIEEAFGTEVALAGVSMDDMIPDAKRGTVVTFLDKQRIAFPNVYYTGLPDALGDLLRFSGEIPITIVYDRKGKELWRHQGRIDRQKTIAQLRGLLDRRKK